MKPISEELAPQQQRPAPRPRAGGDVHLSEGKSMTFLPTNAAVRITMGGMPTPAPQLVAEAVGEEAVSSEGAPPAVSRPAEAVSPSPRSLPTN